MKVTATQHGNMAFKINQSGHEFYLDASNEHGGDNLGPSPKGLLLSGLLGCTGMDVTSMLKKMHLKIDKFELIATTDITDEHPKVFKDINVEYHFWGQDLDRSKIERAISLSKDKYCGVSAMLTEGKRQMNVNIVLHQK